MPTPRPLTLIPATLPWTRVGDALPPVGMYHTLLLAISNAAAHDGVSYSTGYYDVDDDGALFVVDGDDHHGSDAAAVVAWLELTPPSL